MRRGEERRGEERKGQDRVSECNGVYREMGKTLGVEDIAYNSYLENLGLLNESMELELR